MNIKTLTLAQAKEIYTKKYWLGNQCDKIPFPLNALYFDACVNHGGGQAAKFLQRAIGVADDGKVGPGTLGKINSLDHAGLIAACTDFLNQRETFFRNLVVAKPKNSVFLNGWLRRVNFFRTWLNTIK